MAADIGRNQKLGIMLVGALGMTGSATIAGITAMRQGYIPERYGVTSNSTFVGHDLPTATDIEIGGWDYQLTSLHDALVRYEHIPSGVVESCKDAAVPLFPGIITALDYPAPAKSSVRQVLDLDQGTDLIRQDIDSFRQQKRIEHVVVVFVGSPSLRPPHDPSTHQLVGTAESVPSSLVYAMGASIASADFVDFTPGYALEYSALWQHMKSHEGRLAGRDGSTGQTMLKVAISELCSRRGLDIAAWYSTNLIGNRDGLVLTSPGFGEAKFNDKLNALRLPEHANMVDIKYMPHWGDRKESWDAAELRSWLGSQVSMRINWRGSDSELAAPLILDICRILWHVKESGKTGFVPELGFFFKRPFLRENTSLSERWDELVSVLNR